MMEKEIEKKVNTHARETGWLQYKFVSPGKRGVPDRLYFGFGHVMAIEFKTLGLKASALQDKEIRLLRKAGIPCFVIDNVTEGKYVLDHMKAAWLAVSDSETVEVPKV